MTAQSLIRSGCWDQIHPTHHHTAGACSSTIGLIDILDTVDLPIVVVSREFFVTCFNRSAAELLGLAPSDIGRSPVDVPVLGGLCDLEAWCGQAIATGAAYRYDFHDRGKSYLLRIAPYAQSDGRITGCVLTIANVTAFRASIDQAIYEREYTKTILNTVTDPLAVLSGELRLVTWNRAFYTMFHLSRAATQSIPLGEIGNRAFDVALLHVRLRRTLEDDSEFRPFEIDHDFPGIGRRIVLLNARPFSLPGLSGAMLLLALRDITEQKQAEAELQRLAETLEERVAERTLLLKEEIAQREKAEAALRQSQKMEAVGQLTGGVAHDFNNLLTVVTGHLDLLERWTGADGTARHHVDAAHRAAWRGARLTQQLLAFARQQDLRPEIIHLGDAVAEYEGLLRRALGEAIEVTIECDPNLWPSRVDPAQFENSILNLAFNARDAMPAGGRLAISLHNAKLGDSDVSPSAVPGDYVLVAVADTGVGIAPEQIDRVFEPFYTTKEVGRGTGLGLSQVYGFVKQSGGHVRIESAVGAGTTVMIYLPKAAGVAVEREMLDRPGEELAQGCETVLIVEDDESVLEVVTAMIEELGYRVLTARNGLEALSKLKLGELIDLLFTDLVMPNGISGAELAQQARQMRPELKILLGSGYSGMSPVAAAAVASLPILGKPYRQAELAAKVRAVLAGGSNQTSRVG